MSFPAFFLIISYLSFHFFTCVGSRSQLHVTARLMECSEPPDCDSSESSASTEIKNPDAASSGKHPEFQGPALLQECSRKLYIALQIENEGKVSGDDDFVVIDDVEDPVTGNTTHLLNPIILKVHREQVQIIYPLEFQQVVNGGVHEEVIDTRNDSSVCDGSVCGVTKYDGSPLPFSEGFCCSCNGLPDQDTEPPSSRGPGVALLEPGLVAHPVKRSISPEDAGKEKKNSVIPLKSLPCAPFRKNHRLGRPLVFFFEHDKALLGGSPGQTLCSLGPDTEPLAGSSELKMNGKKSYMTYQRRKMPRNQKLQDDYEDTRTGAIHVKHTKLRRKPKKFTNVLLFENEYKYLNPEKVETEQRVRRSNLIKRPPNTLRARIDRERMRKVLEVNRGRFDRKERHSCSARSNEAPSAHCLRFSDLWYSAYTLKEPVIIQELTLQAFQKRDAFDGTTYWADLTRGNVIRLGTYFPQAKDDRPTVAMSYSSSLDPSGKCEGSICPIDADSHLLLVPSHVQEPSTVEEHPEASGGPAEYLVVSKEDVSVDGRGCDRVGTLFDGFTHQADRCQQTKGTCLSNQPVDLWLQDMDRRLEGQRGQYFAENYGTVATVPLTSASTAVKGDFLALEFTSPFHSLVEVEIRADNNALVRKGWNIQIQSITSDSASPQRTVLEVLVVNSGLAPGLFRPWLVECSGELPPDAVPEGPAVLIPPLHRHLFQILMEGALPTATMTCTVEVHNMQQQLVASRQVLVRKQARCLCAFHCSCSCISAGIHLSCAPLMQEEYAAAGYTGGLPRRPGIPAQLPLQTTFLSISLAACAILFLLGKCKIVFGSKFPSIKIKGLDFIRDSLEPCILRCVDPEKKRVFCHTKGTHIVLNMIFFILYPLLIVWMCLLSILSLFGRCAQCCSPRRDSHLLLQSPRPGSACPDTTRRESDEVQFVNGQYEMEEDDTRFVIGAMRMSSGMSVSSHTSRDSRNPSL